MYSNIILKGIMGIEVPNNKIKFRLKSNRFDDEKESNNVIRALKYFLKVRNTTINILAETHESFFVSMIVSFYIGFAYFEKV
jgi:hypothetical protein